MHDVLVSVRETTIVHLALQIKLQNGVPFYTRVLILCRLRGPDSATFFSSLRRATQHLLHLLNLRDSRRRRQCRNGRQKRRADDRRWFPPDDRASQADDSERCHGERAVPCSCPSGRRKRTAKTHLYTKVQGTGVEI